MYYHFKIPNNNLDCSLEALGNDIDVMNLVRLEEIVEVESSASARKPFKKPSLKLNRKQTTDYNDDNEAESVSKSDKEAVNEDKTVSKSDESDDSQDTDFIFDEDNLINEVDIDMQEFYQNTNKDVEWVRRSKGNLEVPTQMDVEEGYD
nr:transposase, mutator type [Tanacetum cinerariifolium]